MKRFFLSLAFSLSCLFCSLSALADVGLHTKNTKIFVPQTARAMSTCWIQVSGSSKHRMLSIVDGAIPCGEKHSTALNCNGSECTTGVVEFKYYNPVSQVTNWKEQIFKLQYRDADHVTVTMTTWEYDDDKQIWVLIDDGTVFPLVDKSSPEAFQLFQRGELVTIDDAITASAVISGAEGDVGAGSKLIAISGRMVAYQGFTQLVVQVVENTDGTSGGAPKGTIGYVLAELLKKY